MTILLKIVRLRGGFNDTARVSATPVVGSTAAKLNIASVEPKITGRRSVGSSSRDRGPVRGPNVYVAEATSLWVRADICDRSL